MNESVLRALLRLFALVTEITDDRTIELAKRQVEAYLRHKISLGLIRTYLSEFEEYLLLFSGTGAGKDEKKARKASTLGSVKVIMICEKINENLSRHEKITVLIRLTEFVQQGGQISFRESNFIETLSKIFNVDEATYEMIQYFVRESENNHSALVYIGSKPKSGHWLERRSLSGHIQALLIPDSSTCFIKYTGPGELRLNDQPMEPQKVYLMQEGGIISGGDFEPIHHHEILKAYHQQNYTQHILFAARNICYHFPSGAVGIQPLSIVEESGAMVGVMGASGAGKSTLINVLNGNLTPSSGGITINGIDVESKSAKQLIGYVPQDDLLIEELSVFENLYYSGLLCLPGLTKGELVNRIELLLRRIDLFDTRHLQVGSVLDKRISGGQRKRLNIALELLREPAVLFVDEPTSGLSSQDSEVVMQLLKQLTYKGKLIFVVIHQPSAHIYKLLDKLLLLDKGGFPVYQGHVMEAPAWFRKHAGFIEGPGEENIAGNHVDPDEMLRILEARQVDEYGHMTSERIQKPEEWYALYQSESTTVEEDHRSFLQSESNHTEYKVPSGWRQFAVYFRRNLLSKVRNRTFLIVALLEAPVLAFIIGYFTRYAVGTEEDPSAYIFFYNKNLPAFLFMAIVVAIFVGMQISAEEIIRDRKILKRESFLNLSKLSYLNSKVLYLILLSAVQSVLLTLVGNAMLEIKGMTGYFFLVLFPTFVFANLVGLNISRAFKSVVTIYILVPFLVVPQLLLSGVIVDFDTLQEPAEQGRETPVIADLMVARWAYEAMAVAQFKRNDYQKHFFDDELEKQQALYEFSFRLPKLQNINRQCLALHNAGSETLELHDKLSLLRKEVAKINERFSLKFDRTSELSPSAFTTLTSDLLDAWLNEIERQYRRIWEDADDRIRAQKEKLAEHLDLPGSLKPLKDKHHNQKLEDHLTNAHELERIRVVDDVMVNKFSYIFKRPENAMGRAHFYAPYKIWFGNRIDSLWFNVFVIWGFNLLLYLTLYHNTLGRLMRFTRDHSRNN